MFTLDPFEKFVLTLSFCVTLVVAFVLGIAFLAARLVDRVIKVLRDR